MRSEHVRATTQMLTIPHGFTLTISGVFAMDVGDTGFPGALPVWLYVVGGSAGFLLLALGTRSHSSTARPPNPPTGRAVLNVVAVVVVPACYAVTAWIPSMALEYLIAGFLAVTLYVGAYAALAQFIDRSQLAR